MQLRNLSTCDNIVVDPCTLRFKLRSTPAHHIFSAQGTYRAHLSSVSISTLFHRNTIGASVSSSSSPYLHLPFLHLISIFFISIFILFNFSPWLFFCLVSFLYYCLSPSPLWSSPLSPFGSASFTLFILLFLPPVLVIFPFRFITSWSHAISCSCAQTLLIY